MGILNRPEAALALLLAGCATAAPAPPPDGFVAIPAGTLTTADGRSIPIRPFALGRTEVTWREFQAFQAEGQNYHERKRRALDGMTHPSPGDYFVPMLLSGDGAIAPDQPVVPAAWHTAMVYCDWLTQKTGCKFRLPTEAEWEYAARAGRTRAVPEEAWFGGPQGHLPRPVGSRAANPWGLQDMLGNAWEHVLEPYERSAYGAAFRGGAHDSPPPEVDLSRREGLRTEWFELDPSRPFSLWWMFGSFSHGFRPACVGTQAELAASREAVGKIGVQVKSWTPERFQLDRGYREHLYRVVGDIVNETGRTLDEVELKVYVLGPDGRPRWADLEEPAPFRPTFTWTYPVLTGSFHDGPHSRPLRPGERRSFLAFVPESLDEFGDPARFGAAATWIRFAP